MLWVVFCLLWITSSSTSLHRELLDGASNIYDDSRIDITTEKLSLIPKFGELDMLEVYHLRSFPLQNIVSTVGTFGIQTSGLALRNVRSKELIVLEYKPMNWSCSFLPIITTNNNRTRLIWDKRAIISYTKSVSTLYWQQSTFLARINAVVYENYIDWIAQYLLQDRIFVPHSICSGGFDETSCFTIAETWDNFIADSLTKLSQLAVQMHAIIPPRANELQVLSNKPDVVTIQDRGVHRNHKHDYDVSRHSRAVNNTEDVVVKYFTDLLQCMQAYQLEEYASALRSCSSENTAYVHSKNNNYYKISPIYPFVLSKEMLQSIPSPYTAKVVAVDSTDIMIGVWLITSILIAIISVFYKLMIHEYICGRPVVIKHVSKGRHHYDETERIVNRVEEEEEVVVGGAATEAEAEEGLEMTNIDIVV